MTEQLSFLDSPRIAYWRVWCLGSCAGYSHRRTEPRRCTCGGDVVAVPVARRRP